MSLPPGEVAPETAYIEPYLNPALWGGRLLDGALRKGDTSGSAMLRADVDSAEAAISYLQETLTGGIRPEPLKTFQPGTTFDFRYGRYHPGTVVLFHQRTLFREEPYLPVPDMRAYRGQALPKGLTELEQALDDPTVLGASTRSLMGYGKAAGAIFQEGLRYGIVARDKARHKRLVVVSAGRLIRASMTNLTEEKVEAGELQRIKIKHTEDLRRERAHIPIGKTRYYKGGKQNKHRLVNVSRLDVLTMGEAA